MPRIKKVLLSHVTHLDSQLPGQLQMIIDHQSHAMLAGHRQYGLRHLANFLEGLIFCPQLDDIRTTLTQLKRHGFRCTAMQIGRVDEGIETTFGE